MTDPSQHDRMSQAWNQARDQDYQAWLAAQSEAEAPDLHDVPPPPDLSKLELPETFTPAPPPPEPRSGGKGWLVVLVLGLAALIAYVIYRALVAAT